MVVCLVLTLTAAYPGLSAVVPSPEEERFTEFWILGPDHKPEGYPFNVKSGESQEPLYLSVQNHLGRTAYYLVYTKIRNQTQLPANRTIAAPLQPIYEFRFFLSNDGEWEKPVIFSLSGQPNKITSISINGLTFPLTSSSTWNNTREGFYYQLMFELWIYNQTQNDFQYHNRYVSIWLNVTSD